jgi:hypothetical protein
MFNRRARIAWLLLILFIAPNVLKSQHLWGIGITLHRKILVSLAYQHPLSPASWVRLRLYFAGGAKPMALGLHGFVADQSGTCWQPYAGAGVEIIPHRFRRQMHWTPYLCATLGTSYRPHETLADQAELTISYFASLRTVTPLGLTLWHFNGLR